MEEQAIGEAVDGLNGLSVCSHTSSLAAGSAVLLFLAFSLFPTLPLLAQCAGEGFSRLDFTGVWLRGSGGQAGASAVLG